MGWTCGVALAWHFVLAPLTILYAYAGVELPELPTFDMSSLRDSAYGHVRAWRTPYF